MVSSQQNKHFLIAYIVQTGTWGLYVCVWRFNWWSVQHHQPLKSSIKNGHLNLLHTHTLSSAPYAVILHYQTSTELMPLPSTNICKQSQLPEKLQTDPGSPSFIPSPLLNSLHYYFPQRSSARSPTKHQFQIQILYQARLSFSLRSSSGSRTWRDSTWISSGCAATSQVCRAESCPTRRACSPLPAAPPKPPWDAWGFSQSPPFTHW